MSKNEFDKIIGYTSIKKELKQIADTLKNNDVYKALGVSAPKGLLLYGEPGVGKTLMANCLIKSSQLKNYVCRKNQPNGDFIKHIKETFNKAVENAPSIVFLDDMDKFANGDERHKNAEEYVTVQSCIDEVKDKDVFVLATVNNLRNLPYSLLRAGRFDRSIEVGAPTGQDAICIIEHYLKRKKFTTDIDVKSIARILNGRSCAQLETVINEAGLYAGFNRCDKITMEHFMEACMRIIFDVPSKAFNDQDFYSDLHNSNNVTSKIIYHEAGHAVISEILCPESVALVSAYSGQGEHGGITSYYRSTEEPPFEWRKSRILTSLGGMAAVEQKFGVVETGSYSDLNQAFNQVRQIVTDDCVCGFSLYSRGFGDSSELQSHQEHAIATEVEKYYRKAKEILSLNAEFFEKVAVELAKKKLLYTADIQKIKAECTIIPVSI